MGQVIKSDSMFRTERRGESVNGSFPRNLRFFSEDNGWYFRTRERTAVGPYLSREEAEAAARVFVDHTQSDDDETLDLMIDLHLASLRIDFDESRQSNLLRRGEWEIPAERSNRIINKSDRWYFFTREGRLVGPYDCEESAKEWVDVFRNFARNIRPTSILGLIEAMNEGVESEISY